VVGAAVVSAVFAPGAIASIWARIGGSGARRGVGRLRGLAFPPEGDVTV